jgi:purine-binding chemotaxis protein CheW
MASPERSTTPTGGVQQRFLTFRVEEQLYALPAQDVSEVIHPPTVARVPQGPKSLLGLGNLRGFVLPVVSLRALLGLANVVAPPGARAIVLDNGTPVALVVDAIEVLTAIDAEKVESRQAELGAGPAERLLGAFYAGSGDRVAKVLDIRGMVATAFKRPGRAKRNARSGLATAMQTSAPDPAVDQHRLVTFEVAGQDYALPLEAVQEIVAAPAIRAVVPHAEALMLGVMPYRESLLPLLSLRGLLGFQPATTLDGREKVVVAAVGGTLVGLLADRMRAIVPADPSLIEPSPAMLSARTGGESRIAAIYRGEAGRRLVSILAPEQLFREDVMKRLAAAPGPQERGNDGVQVARGTELSFLVFRLGSDEFGLPIDAVDEVAVVPEQITRVPKTPKFLEGVINLRGEVLPVVDQRRRFDMPKLEDGAGRRLVVVRTQRHRAGLIVDSVSEVLRCSTEAVEKAPELTEDIARLIQGVVNLEEAERIVLLLDPTELLTRAERGLLDTFETDAGQAN